MALQIQTEVMGAVLSDLVKFEINPLYTRENITTGAAVTAGTVLGRVTASGAYIPFDNTAADGSQTPVAVALFDAASGDTVAAIRRGAILAKANLVWAAGVDATEQAAALLVMAENGIVAQ